MSFEMPLFPLNVVLFPEMQLPLHIFEPRYRLMTRRVLDDDAVFGVALLLEGEEGEPGTYPASVGCTAEIIENTSFPDGRLNLLTVGRRRFRILALREEDEYFVGTCEWLEDEAHEVSPQQTHRVRTSLRAYLMSLARNANLSAHDFDELEIPHDAYGLSMWVASLITLPNSQKQELLEMTSTAARLQIEQAFLLRGEIVQRAFARKQSEPTSQREDDSGPFASFISLN